MAATRDLVGVEEAAKLLGVTARQVRYLADRGELALVARGIVDRTSLERHMATRQGSRVRAWSQETAWAALALLSGLEVNWLGQVQKSRLRAALRKIDARELISRARDRARVHHFSGHASTASRLRREVVSVGLAGDLGLVGDAGQFDGYVRLDELNSLIARHGLSEDANGRYCLRATTFDMREIANLAAAGEVLAAIDAAESLDARERAVGIDALQQALESFRD